MSSNQPASPKMDLGELLLLETSVLRTLCLTVNSESSELKDRILGSLVEENFYFPVTRTVFTAVCSLNRNGEQVRSSSLQQVLNELSVDVPDDFFVEDLFVGDTPSPATLAAWIGSLTNEYDTSKGDSASKAGLEKTHPSVSAPSPEEPPAKRHDESPPEPDDAVAETEPTKRPAAERAIETPSKGRPAAPRSKPEEKERPQLSPASGGAAASPHAEVGKASSASASEVSRVDRSSSETPIPEEPSPTPTIEGGTPVHDVLSPESGEWLGFLAELTKKQGERLKTGFSGFDAEWGGLGPGLLLLAGDQRPRLLDFLKQLVDQIAIHCRVPCLYLSFERTKAALRMQTLSRLSGAPVEDIENGRFEKDSAEWQNVVRVGEQAVEWLQRIYVVEAEPGLAVTRIRELRQGLIGSGAGPTCLIAVDNLEKLASKTDLLQSVAELKELAEALGIAVVGAAAKLEPVHVRSADMVVTFREQDGELVLEVRTPGASDPRLLRFAYRPETHRFDERPSG